MKAIDRRIRRMEQRYSAPVIVGDPHAALLTELAAINLRLSEDSDRFEELRGVDPAEIEARTDGDPSAAAPTAW